MTVNKNKPIPYYYQVELLFREKIENKEWQTNTFIPPERVLGEEFGVSRITIRKAIGNLVKHGYLKKIKGKGTVVVKRCTYNDLFNQAHSFYEYLRGMDFNVINKIIEFEIKIPSNLIKSFLRLKKDEKIYSIRRLRLVDGEPWYYTDIFLPAKWFKDLKSTDIAKGSILKVFSEKSKLEVFKSKRRLYPCISNSEQSKILSIDKNSPIQIIDTINYSKKNLPLEYAINYFRPDKVIIEAVFDKGVNILKLKEKLNDNDV